MNGNPEVSSIIPRSLVRRLHEVDASGAEVFVLMALLHHKPNERGEIGISSDGHAMSSADIAERSGITDGHVRHAIGSLKCKGVLETARHAFDGGARKAVYRLADESLTRDLASCFDAYENMEV